MGRISSHAKVGTRAKKRVAKTRTKADLEKALALAQSSRGLVSTQLAGSLLETIVAFIATGKEDTTLREVVDLANKRAREAEWRQTLHRAINGAGL